MQIYMPDNRMGYWNQSAQVTRIDILSNRPLSGFVRLFELAPNMVI